MTTKSREYPSRTEIQCNICYEYFFNSSSLRRHRRNLHGIVEPPYLRNSESIQKIRSPKLREYPKNVTGREYSILSPPEVTKQWKMIVERESSSQKAAGRR